MAIEPARAWDDFMAQARARLAPEQPLETRGTLTRLTGLVLEATGHAFVNFYAPARCTELLPDQRDVLVVVVVPVKSLPVLGFVKNTDSNHHSLLRLIGLALRPVASV